MSYIKTQRIDFCKSCKRALRSTRLAERCWSIPYLSVTSNKLILGKIKNLNGHQILGNSNKYNY